MSSANDDGVHTHARPTTANLQRRRRAPSAGDGATTYFANGDRFCFLFSITMRVPHTRTHISQQLCLSFPAVCAYVERVGERVENVNKQMDLKTVAAARTEQAHSTVSVW